MAVPSSPLDALRPKPFRGDVIAAGVVVLTTLVWVVRVRFAASWGPVAQGVWAFVPWAFVTLEAVLAPMERDEPRAYQSVLYVASVALALAVLVSLGEIAGADGAFSTAGNTTWVTGALAAWAFVFAVARNSAVCTLLGAVSAGAAVLAAVHWAWSPSPATDRWVLVALMVVYGFAAIGQRDRRLRHGVALIDAAGTAVLLIAVSLVFSRLAQVAPPAVPFVDPAMGTLHVFSSDASVGWGWELLILAAGFGLIAYSSVDRQPGPAYLGVLNLIFFAVITSLGVAAGSATLLGWPLALALASAALLAIGLRPTTPAPPPPDLDAPEPPPLPLR